MASLRRSVVVLAVMSAILACTCPAAGASDTISVDPYGGAIPSDRGPGTLSPSKQAAYDSMVQANNRVMAAARIVASRNGRRANLLPGGDGGGGWGPGDGRLSYSGQFQSKAWYCVPAAARTAISVSYLLVGRSPSALPSQDTLANALGTVAPVGGSGGGTVFANIAPVLNKYQTNNAYIFSTPADWGTYASSVQLDVSGYASSVPVTVNPRLLAWDYPLTSDSNHAIDTVGFHYTTTSTRLDMWDPEPVDTSSGGAEYGYNLSSIWTSMNNVPGQSSAEIAW